MATASEQSVQKRYPIDAGFGPHLFWSGDFTRNHIPRRLIKLGWAYNRQFEQPVWAAETDVEFPSIVMRGASRFIPALERYVEQLPTPVVQYAGYYTRTRENWPMIGPLDHPDLYAVAALSGYGTMAACAAGELCANWIMNEPLPGYAENFHPDRYDNPAVQLQLSRIDSDGQL